MLFADMMPIDQILGEAIVIKVLYPNVNDLVSGFACAGIVAQ